MDDLPTIYNFRTRAIYDGEKAPRSTRQLPHVPTFGVPYNERTMLVGYQDGDIELVRDNAARPFFSFAHDIGTLPAWTMAPFAEERGLLGGALHPLYWQSNSEFSRVAYFYYSTSHQHEDSHDHVTVLEQVRFAGTDGGPVEARKQLLHISQPEANHNGGTLVFGPAHEDSRRGIGYLYVSVGDGGGAGDDHGIYGNAQNLSTVLGKILRIDVNYKVGDATCVCTPAPENRLPGGIYAYGLRNAWKISFDGDGRLFAADVGQTAFEEVHIVRNGDNCGWAAVEGGTAHDFTHANVFREDVYTAIGGFKAVAPPILHYDRRGRGPSAAIGGHVYRGDNVPPLRGVYVFGDYNGTVFYAREDKSGVWHQRILMRVSGALHSFMQTARGELWMVVAHRNGVFSIEELTYNGLTQRDVDRLMDAAAHHTVPSRVRDGRPQVFVAVARRDHIDDDAAVDKIEVQRFGHDAWDGSRAVARGKAFTAMAFAQSTAQLGEATQPGGDLWGIGHTNRAFGEIVTFGGGLPLWDHDGRVVGAVGVSGDAVEVDEKIAAAIVASYYSHHT